MPYTFEKKLTEKFQEISDLFFCRENQRLYVADRQANSIVILNSKFEKTHVLNTFDNHGTADAFVNCSGVCVRDGILYVADSGNSRIVTFRADDYSFIRTFDKPEITQLGAGYTYKPIRLESPDRCMWWRKV